MGSSDLSGAWRFQGHLPPAGVGRGRAGSSQEARDGAERRPHKSQTEVPSSRARTQTNDSKAKVRREPWGGAAGPAGGMMDGACLETLPLSQSVQGGEELLRASSPSDSIHPTPPHPYGAVLWF